MALIPEWACRATKNPPHHFSGIPGFDKTEPSQNTNHHERQALEFVIAGHCLPHPGLLVEVGHIVHLRTSSASRCGTLFAAGLSVSASKSAHALKLSSALMLWNPH